MDWSQGVDVVKGEDVIVLIDLPGGQLAAQDPREDVSVVIGLRRIDRHEGLRLTGVPRPLPRAGMSDETPESLIPYDEIVQEALRDVVGRVLGQVERTGALPGDHHFYITFKTRMPGVSIPKHLTERFPDEMTIVLQHRFWDLKVEKDSFSVGLSFGGVPSTLHVPFAAVTDFVDPAVDFSLKFQANGADDMHEEHEEAENDAPLPEASDDGSNVVNVDFTRKK
jgi:hypothetical protein